jgi:hypothetical protein
VEMERIELSVSRMRSGRSPVEPHPQVGSRYAPGGTPYLRCLRRIKNAKRQKPDRLTRLMVITVRLRPVSLFGIRWQILVCRPDIAMDPARCVL